MDKIAFVCEGNAGRSQLATALAERERDRRGFELDIVTGGIAPSDHVHEEVVEVLAEEGIDISGRTPREISSSDIVDADYVVTMGCTVDEFKPDGWEGTAEQWNLEHPSAGDLDSARQQRDEIERRIHQLFETIAKD